MAMVRLAIDFENPALEWWESGGQELWESIVEGFDNNDVVLDDSLAQSWLHQAALVPGWHSGPDYAPHPVRLQEIDEDEIV